MIDCTMSSMFLSNVNLSKALSELVLIALDASFLMLDRSFSMTFSKLLNKVGSSSLTLFIFSMMSSFKSIGTNEQGSF